MHLIEQKAITDDILGVSSVRVFFTMLLCISLAAQKTVTFSPLPVLLSLFSLGAGIQLIIFRLLSSQTYDAEL